MSSLLKEIRVGGVTIPNRFIRSSLWEKMSDPSGVPSQRLIKTITQLAEGKVGLILPGVVFPSNKARLNPFQAGFSNDQQIEGWRPAVENCHKNGSKIIFQFSHGGAKAAVPRLPTQKDDVPEMKISEIDELIQDFTKAAKGAYKIGADGVQLQCAQGFLLSTFLSPLTNHRTDKYGGSIDNRIRIVQEAVDSIRSSTNPNFVISIKMNGDDLVEGGIRPRDAAEIVNKLKNIDLFEISCAINGGLDGIRPVIHKSLFKNTNPQEKKQLEYVATHLRREAPYHEGYNVIAATIIKKYNPNKVIAAVGGMRNFALMEDYIKTGMVDMVSIARPFIRDPYLVKNYIEGKSDKIACESCNECSLRPGEFIHCHFPTD